MQYNDQELANRLLKLLSDRSVMQGYSRGGGRSGASVTVTTDSGIIQAIAVGSFPPGDCLAIRDPDSGEWFAYSANAGQVVRSQSYRRHTRIEPEQQAIFNFYVGFDRYITKAQDKGGRSLPINSFFEDIDQYSGAEPGFVSSRDRFIYSVGSDLKTIYRINVTTLESELILSIAASYPNHLFTSLCMGPSNTLYGAFRKSANDGYLYRRTNDGAESFFFLDTGGTQWSIATLDNVSVYLVTDYAAVNKFDIATQSLTNVRPFPMTGVDESTFLFADNLHQSLYLFGLLDTLPRGQSVIWRIANDEFLEHYRFNAEDGSGNLARFYGLPSRSAIADGRTRTIFMIGVDTIYTNNGEFGTTISNTDKIIRIDRSKKRTDFTLTFDNPTVESRFDSFGQIDWNY